MEVFCVCGLLGEVPSASLIHEAIGELSNVASLKEWSRESQFGVTGFVDLIGPDCYKCNFCDKVFNQRSNCNKHVRSVHMNIKYSCSLCIAKLSSKQALQKHMASHK